VEWKSVSALPNSCYEKWSKAESVNRKNKQPQQQQQKQQHAAATTTTTTTTTTSAAGQWNCSQSSIMDT
jgi:hypothetical protein